MFGSILTLKRLEFTADNIFNFVSFEMKGLVFYVNRLLADDSHTISSLIFPQSQERYYKIVSASVVVGSLRVNSFPASVVC